MKTIKIYDFVGNIAADTEQGRKVYDILNQSLKAKEIVTLDFSSMDTILSMFLNVAIGALYADYTSQFLNEHIKIVNIKKDDFIILSKVLSRAKEYYSDPDLTAKRLDDAYKN